MSRQELAERRLGAFQMELQARRDAAPQGQAPCRGSGDHAVPATCSECRVQHTCSFGFDFRALEGVNAGCVLRGESVSPERDRRGKTTAEFSTLGKIPYATSAA